MRNIEEILMYDSSYLRIAVEQLNNLAIYPDIEINTYISLGCEVHYIAKLSLPNNEIIKAQTKINVELTKDEDIIKQIKNNLLKEIGFKYLKRAYETREKKQDITKSCQVSGIAEKLIKLKSKENK